MRIRVSALLLVLGLAPLLCACGDEERSGAANEDPQWSNPATETASGSPDGNSGAVRTAEVLLGHLRSRIKAGEGPATDARFGRDVADVAAVLWAPEGAGADPAAAQAHVQLTLIAGDVARALAQDPAATVQDSERKIHAAWLAAAQRGPAAYGAWCGSDGAALLEAHQEAVRARLMK